MREVELTIKVLEELEEIIKRVEAKGFKLFEKYYMKDLYMIHNTVDLNMNNYEILKKCLLLRDIVDDNPKKFITYKNKNYDVDGRIISQNKTKIKIDSIDSVKAMFEMLDYNVLFEVENNSLIYKKDDTEIAIQSITNPKGIYIEIEATDSELLELNDEKVKEVLKNKLDDLNLLTTGEYEVKKAFIALDAVRKNRY